MEVGGRHTRRTLRSAMMERESQVRLLCSVTAPGMVTSLRRRRPRREMPPCITWSVAISLTGLE